MAFPSLVTLYQIAILLSFGYFDLLKLQPYNIKISLNNRTSIFLNLRLVRNITLVLSYNPMPFYQPCLTVNMQYSEVHPFINSIAYHKHGVSNHLLCQRFSLFQGKQNCNKQVHILVLLTRQMYFKSCKSQSNVQRHELIKSQLRKF